MVQDDEPVGLDGSRVVFDDERVVCDAGIVLVATLAERLGVEALVDRFVMLRRDRPGAANAGRKVMALIYAMLLGADSIDDCALLRAGRTRRLLGGWLPAPSTLGTFLRAFTFGHVRQLDRLLAETLTRAWRAGAGPGEGRLVVDVDSFIGEVHGYKKQGAGFGYTKKRGYHPLMASRADSGEVLHVRLRKGKANSSRGVLRFAEELIARVARAGASGEKLLRADSAFWNKTLMKRLERAGWVFSITFALFKGALTGPSPVDRARIGSKHHLITDSHGIPLAINLTGGNRNDVTRLLALVDGVGPVKGKPGRPRQRADRVLADRGYDHDKYRRQLWARGVKPVIARRGTDHGSGLGRQRWVVERTFAHLHNLRRLRTRYERSDHLHYAFMLLGCAVVCQRFLAA